MYLTTNTPINLPIAIPITRKLAICTLKKLGIPFKDIEYDNYMYVKKGKSYEKKITMWTGTRRFVVSVDLRQRRYRRLKKKRIIQRIS